MKKLYKYTGTVSSFSYCGNNPNALPFATLDLYDINDDNKAPIRIETIGGLADYIKAIEGTDAEERYLAASWYYDNLLFLHRIEIPSTEPGEPARVIAQHDPIEPAATIFGPAEYVETRRPEPMDKEQRRARGVNTKPPTNIATPPARPTPPPNDTPPDTLDGPHRAKRRHPSQTAHKAQKGGPQNDLLRNQRRNRPLQLGTLTRSGRKRPPQKGRPLTTQYLHRKPSNACLPTVFMRKYLKELRKMGKQPAGAAGQALSAALAAEGVLRYNEWA